ncbi:MAG TPA: hypothetical protein VMK84_15250, partial [Streptosporangiaceae bacterium]|nr:hypothetical protein [Streptosporangiaceae bacterium]
MLPAAATIATGRSRTPHAECGPADISGAVAPALPLLRSGSWPRHAACPPPRAPPQALRRSGDPAAG